MGNTQGDLGHPCAVCGHKPAFALWWAEVGELRCYLHSPYSPKESLANSGNVVYNDGGEAWMANVLCDEKGGK